MIVVDEPVDPRSVLATIDPPAGWTRRKGLSLPREPWDLRDRRWMCVGAITDDASAELALEALVRGVGLVVAIGGSGRFRLQVLDDLHHNGSVEHHGDGAGGDEAAPDDGPSGARPPVVLAEEDEMLLAALARGATIDKAARQVMMSPRTAQRRLAVIREAYGAANTTEAVALWSADRAPGT